MQTDIIVLPVGMLPSIIFVLVVETNCVGRFTRLAGTIGVNLLEEQRRTTDARDLEIDRDFHAVGDANERNPALHAKLLPVKGHRPLQLAGAFALWIIVECQGFGFRDTPNCKCSLNIETVRPGLDHLGGMMYGSFFTSKNFSLLSSPSLKPLPVSTLSA